MSAVSINIFYRINFVIFYRDLFLAINNETVFLYYYIVSTSWQVVGKMYSVVLLLFDLIDNLKTQIECIYITAFELSVNIKTH